MTKDDFIRLARRAGFAEYDDRVRKFARYIYKDAFNDGMRNKEPFGYFQYDLRLDAWVKSQRGNGVAFYTLPPQHEWVGLTDEEMRQAAQAMDSEPLAEGWKELIKFARAIESKLKDKNK